MLVLNTNHDVFSFRYRSGNYSIDSIDQMPINYKHRNILININIIFHFVIVVFFGIARSTKEAGGAAEKIAIPTFETTAEARKDHNCNNVTVSTPTPGTQQL